MAYFVSGKGLHNSNLAGKEGLNQTTSIYPDKSSYPECDYHTTNTLQKGTNLLTLPGGTGMK